MSDKPEDVKRAETKEKLRAFLRSGGSDDVASVLVHTLMESAEKQAQKAPKNGKK